MSFKKRDIEVEQTIFLGGKISAKHEVFKLISMMSPDYAEAYIFFDKYKEWKKLDKDKRLKELIKAFGQIDFMRSVTELTKLSMILGDPTKHYSLKKATEENVS